MNFIVELESTSGKNITFFLQNSFVLAKDSHPHTETRCRLFLGHGGDDAGWTVLGSYKDVLVKIIKSEVRPR
jgi:hypothetical protein